MTQKNEKGGERMLVLGFDAGCGTCRDIASRVERRLGDALTVRNLSDPEVMNWREEALGKDAPFAPTLFEVNGEAVKAWTGKGMALPLSRKLGLSKTWQLMQALGEMPNSGIQTVEAPRTGMSRGSFLKGVGGAAVAMSVLSGAGPLASVAQAATKHPYDIVKGRKLTGTELLSTAKRVGYGSDVRNLVGNQLSTLAKVKAAEPAAWLHSLRNGTAQRVVVYQLPTGRMLSFVEFTQPPKGKAATTAKLFIQSESQSRLTTVKASEGGYLWRRANSISSSRSTSGTQPLGECPPVSSKPPSHGLCGWSKISVCADWKFGLRCGASGVLAGASCTGCAVGVFGTGVTGGAAAPAPAYACPQCAGAGGIVIASCCVQWCEVWAPANCL